MNIFAKIKLIITAYKKETWLKKLNILFCIYAGPRLAEIFLNNQEKLEHWASKIARLPAADKDKILGRHPLLGGYADPCRKSRWDEDFQK
jgi:hypothetical protein